MTVLRMPLALLFDSVGTGEWLLLLVVILIVYGPKRLPEMARKLGGWLAKLHHAADLLREQLADLETESQSDGPDTPQTDPNKPGATSTPIDPLPPAPPLPQSKERSPT
jgi:sec-independent protein translocase protein TatA